MEISLEKHDDAIVRSEDNENYKLNKRIDRRITALRAKTKEALNVIGELCTEDEARYTKKRLKNIGELLHYFERNNINTNLELLALNILFVNFDPNERKKIPVHEAYLFFTDSKNFLDDNADLIGKTLKDSVETDMFLLAYDCINRLKA